MKVELTHGVQPWMERDRMEMPPCTLKKASVGRQGREMGSRAGRGRSVWGRVKGGKQVPAPQARRVRACAAQARPALRCRPPAAARLTSEAERGTGLVPTVGRARVGHQLLEQRRRVAGGHHLLPDGQVGGAQHALHRHLVQHHQLRGWK